MYVNRIIKEINKINKKNSKKTNKQTKQKKDKIKSENISHSRNSSKL